MEADRMEIREGRLQGRVTSIEKTGENAKDGQQNVWEKCVMTLELVGFSKRTPEKNLPAGVKGKQIKFLRWCCYDWHYRIGTRKTLEPNETEAVLMGKPTATAYW